MFVPIILGSDKTVVSVATGHNEFWPLYMSIGNVHNKARRAHGTAVVLIGFLSIPKSEDYSLASVNLLLIWLNSGQETRWKQGFSEFPATDVSLIASQDSFLPRTGHDRA
jgi:Plavaka transposase